MEELNKSLGWCLAAALLLHWLLFRLPITTFPLGSKNEAKNSPIEIAPYPTQDKPIVETSRAEQQVEKHSKAKFSSDVRNRVAKQTQSPLKGRFQEGRSAHSPEVATEGEHQATKGPRLSDLLQLGRTPNDLGRDIEQGNETVLDTDPVRYASFVQRIADEIYDPWTQRVEEAITGLRMRGQRLETNSYITKLDVEMNRDGHVVAITTLQSCGIPAFDDAAKKVFWETEPFPNPPEGLFHDSGEVHFGYEFHLELSTSSFNILPWSI